MRFIIQRQLYWEKAYPVEHWKRLDKLDVECRHTKRRHPPHLVYMLLGRGSVAPSNETTVSTCCHIVATTARSEWVSILCGVYVFHPYDKKTFIVERLLLLLGAILRSRDTHVNTIITYRFGNSFQICRRLLCAVDNHVLNGYEKWTLEWLEANELMMIEGMGWLWNYLAQMEFDCH